MSAEHHTSKTSRWAWIKQNVIGLGFGLIFSLYGVVAILTDKAFLPALQGEEHILTNTNGFALGGAYLTGGIFLLLRFYLEKKVHAQPSRANLYLVQNLVLIALIAALAYVLLHVGTAQ